MRKSDLDGTWLDPLLERHLGRVTAPAELWDRIETPLVANAGNVARRLAWVLAGAMVLVAIVWGFHLRGATPTEARTTTGSACLLCHVAMNRQSAPGPQTVLN